VERNELCSVTTYVGIQADRRPLVAMVTGKLVSKLAESTTLLETNGIDDDSYIKEVSNGASFHMRS
jgi:hypothetical protein